MYHKYFLALVFFAFTALAQKFEVRDVAVSDLDQKTLVSDPSAEAAVLFRIGEVSFRYDKDKGFKILTKVKTRIKIYNSKGYDRGNFEMQYYDAVNATRERLMFDNAITYNLVNGKVEKTKLRSDGIFDSKLNKFWGQKKIAMPNVREGSIIEFEYTLESPNIMTLPEWDFQDRIPVVYSEFKTVIPEYLVYSHHQKGYYLLDVETRQSQNTISYHEKHEDEGVVVKAYTEEVNVKFTETVTTYKAKDLVAMRDEKYLSGYRNYVCSISHELMMTQFPNSTTKSFSTSWETVARRISEDDDFGAELSKTGYFENDIKTLTANLTKPEDKLAAIFGYVKENFKWNGFRNYWCHQGVKTAFKEKSGNVAEINLMLTAMLRSAGLDANPVLISTRSHGISLFPANSAFDYVITSVNLAGKNVLLDATEPFATPNVLPLRAINWKGLQINRDGSTKEIDLTPQVPAVENMTLAYMLSADGNVEGKVRRQLSSNIALDFRRDNFGVNNEQYLEQLENDNGKIEISEYKRENEAECFKDCIESYSFKKNSAVDAVGDKLYLSPMLFLAQAENPFKLETRTYPVDFGFAIKHKYIVLIDLPPGYAVESLPSGTALATEGQFGTFRYTIAQNGSRLQLIVNSEISQAIVPTETYPILKEFYQKMVDKQNEKIILKRI